MNELTVPSLLRVVVVVDDSIPNEYVTHPHSFDEKQIY